MFLSESNEDSLTAEDLAAESVHEEVRGASNENQEITDFNQALKADI